MLALAIVFAFSHARRFGIDSDRMVDVILIGTVCAVIGGRAFYVATAPFEYASFAEMLDIRLGGVAIYGAVIAAFLSGYFACRWRKVPILPMFDLAGMGFLLGQGIGRWGNFVNQDLQLQRGLLIQPRFFYKRPEKPDMSEADLKF